MGDSLMDVQPTNLTNCVMLSCQYGPESLRNVSNSLLNLCHEELRQFWRQKGYKQGLLIKWPVSVCVGMYIYIIYIYICDESAAPPIIIFITPSFNIAFTRLPTGVGWWRGGALKQAGWRRVMRHTGREWSLITAAVICRAPLSGDRSLPVHARWCPRGSRKGGRGRHAARDAGPLSGRDPYLWYGRRARMPGRPAPLSAVGQEVDEPLDKPPPLAPGTQQGACADRRTPPLPGPFLLEQLPLLHKARSTTRAPDPPVYFGHFSSWTLLLIILC